MHVVNVVTVSLHSYTYFNHLQKVPNHHVSEYPSYPQNTVEEREGRIELLKIYHYP
jgi:hypothetical protein